MHFQLVTSLLVMIFLAACGNELASNRNNLATESNTPSLSADDTISSQMHRQPGKAPITYQEEINRFLRNLVTSSYRKVPDLDEDFEVGALTKKVQKLGRPIANCGNQDESKMNGVKARLEDCTNKNRDIENSTYYWSASKYGSAGEGDWQLVSLSGEKEIWMDLKTGMVWSEEKATVNWCKASGNMNTGTEIDCALLGAQSSVCIGKTTTWLGDDIDWRLPTRNDFLQADLDGLRLIITKDNFKKTFWTATLDSITKKNGWTYNLPQGTLQSSPVEEEHLVRCIGTPRP